MKMRVFEVQKKNVLHVDWEYLEIVIANIKKPKPKKNLNEKFHSNFQKNLYEFMK